MAIIIITIENKNMEFAVLAIWIASLITYLSSPSQQIIKAPLNKKTTWPAFIALLSVSNYLFNQYFSLSISLLISLASLMLMWIAIILLTGHHRLKLLPFSVIGSVVVVSLVQLGG